MSTVQYILTPLKDTYDVHGVSHSYESIQSCTDKAICEKLFINKVHNSLPNCSNARMEYNQHPQHVIYSGTANAQEQYIPLSET
jgi:hypothetical protein